MYRKIMVPLDGSKLAECVIPHVESIAKGCGTEEVILFRVCEPPAIPADYPHDLTPNWEDHVRQQISHIQEGCRLYLDDTEKKLVQSGLKVTTKAALGNAAESIVDFAVQNKINLIIMASHGRSGISRWAYGSTADKVLHAIRTPVLVIRADECQAKPE